MRWAVFLITFLRLLMESAMGAAPSTFQGRLVISEINGQKVTFQDVSSSAISLGPAGEAEIRGEVSGLDQRAAADYLVQVVIHRLYDGLWWIAGNSELEFTKEAPGKSSKSGKPVAAWHWVVRGVRFPRPDLGKGFEIRAALIGRESAALSEGVIDYETVRRYAIAFTDPVRGNIDTQAALQNLTGDCGITIASIRDLYGKQVRVEPGNEIPIEVDLASIIKGEVDKPEDTYEYLVVQPTTDDRKWVMPRKGTLSQRNWTETAYLGREGLDKGELYRVQAVVSKAPIPPQAYSPDAWRRLESNICARSGEIMVRRRIGPGDLVIQKVDDHEVIGKNPIPAAPECQVEGSIEDPKPEHALQKGETVWILIRPVGGEGWTVKALALPSTDGFSWRVPALHFPKIGQYKIIAVAARTQLPRERTLNNDDWYRLVNARLLRRLSRMVTVNVQPAASPQ